ncbi:glycosyltransferase [Collinsella aerofaciens]|uniref:glycosyltransferase n=1 Tax=Collinsella aerofaciens TaxID=74426 RepID=UPI0034A15EBF
MINYKLANILLEGSAAFSNYPTLLYRRESSGKVFTDIESHILQGPDCFDFTTYFNSLPVSKWRMYTKAERFFVHLEFMGAPFRLLPTYASALDWSSIKQMDCVSNYPSSDNWQSLDVELVPDSKAVLASFCIKTDGELRLRNCYFYTEVEEDDLSTVELALATTTFKKEAYILKNLDLIKENVLGSHEHIADHFRVHVIDNGRTLDVDSLSTGLITIHPNPNVGGSGGFARGMIESLEQNPKATHVLLMDDDVEVLPESFIRTFNLLSLLKEEYSNAFLSGAMMSLEEPNLRTEDLGFFTAKGTFSPLKPGGFMTSLHDVVETEIYRAPTGLYEDTAQQYAGWWYCVIPTATIEREGLPLPLFVRSDDAEYALRCKPKFMSMNGICVWHNSFNFKYSAAVERYQVSRNTLISQATTGAAPLSDFLYEIRREVELDLKKFNYDEAVLAVKGLEDFLRGPEWISHPVAESRFMAANREREQLIPIEQLIPQALELGVDLTQLTFGNLSLGGDRSRLQALKDYLTINGHRFVNDSAKRNGRVAVIDAAGWVYPAGKIRDVDTLIVVDMPNKKGAIRHMDKKRFKEVWTRFRKAEKEFKRNKDKIYAEYASYRDVFTSIDFWKQYLKEASE